MSFACNRIAVELTMFAAVCNLLINWMQAAVPQQVRATTSPETACILAKRCKVYRARRTNLVALNEVERVGLGVIGLSRRDMATVRRIGEVRGHGTVAIYCLSIGSSLLQAKVG